MQKSQEGAMIKQAQCLYVVISMHLKTTYVECPDDSVLADAANVRGDAQNPLLSRACIFPKTHAG